MKNNSPNCLQQTVLLSMVLNTGEPCRHSFKKAEMGEGHCCCKLTSNFQIEQFQRIGPKYFVLRTMELGFPISYDRTGATTYLRTERLCGA